MRYLMLGLVCLFMMGCATTQLEKRVEVVEELTVMQHQVIQRHETILKKLMKIVKRGLLI